MDAVPSSPSQPELAPAPPLGMEAFAHWLDACGQHHWMPLSPAAASPYRFIWGAWLKFIAAQADSASAEADAGIYSDALEEQPWLSATPEQVLQFLTQATRSQKQLSQPSAITQRRYWRVLDRIYQHAQLHGWVEHNPVQGLAAQDRPPSEDPQGAILSPRMWRALQQQIPTATDLISARDRAVLLVLMQLGLSSEEVRSLVLEDLVWQEEEAALQPPAVGTASKLEAKPQQARITALRISGTRAMQPRTLEVAPLLAEALHSWLAYRAGYAPMAQQPALFCTRKAPALSTHTVLHLVSKTLQAASALHPQELPPRMGPQVVRNTVIVQWLQSGISETEVLQRAGLKTPHALGHLQQFVDWE
ncbi:tyrosine-type recombinase/integrase [Comamonas sp. GB3 AK4-5]|uniref:tyrosine-type recombinase/integrase n=1 Tax=Comamonas sp. GB3 AK4-5 TaxID=3231487 RepID=UPI00351DF377